MERRKLCYDLACIMCVQPARGEARRSIPVAPVDLAARGRGSMLRSRMYSMCSTSPWEGEPFNSGSSAGSRSSGAWIYATISDCFPVGFWLVSGWSPFGYRLVSGWVSKGFRLVVGCGFRLVSGWFLNGFRLVSGWLPVGLCLISGWFLVSFRLAHRCELRGPPLSCGIRPSRSGNKQDDEDPAARADLRDPRPSCENHF